MSTIGCERRADVCCAISIRRRCARAQIGWQASYTVLPHSLQVPVDHQLAVAKQWPPISRMKQFSSSNTLTFGRFCIVTTQISLALAHRHRPTAAMTGLCAANNVLVIAMANGTLLRIPLHSVDQQTGITWFAQHMLLRACTRHAPEIRLGAAGAATRVTGLFLDPTGSHTLLATANNETYYLHASNATPKLLQKLKVGIAYYQA